MDSQFSLLKTQRFLPLFLVQFYGAFNDNLLKTFLVVLIAYGLWDIHGWDPAVLVAVAAGLFILPFVLFCPLAGNLSDKYDKAQMIRWIKLAEIGIAFLAVLALFSGNLYFAFFVLLLLGAQSAFFSPCKFAILPQHLKSEELISGNAWVSSGTYMAILAGTILGALLAPLEDGKMIVSMVTLLVAAVGYWAALFIPAAPPPEPTLKISYNVFGRIYEVFKHALNQPSGVFIGIAGVAFFYFVAATFHAQFPNFTKATLGADNIVLTVFMIMFSCGVALGGLLNHKILKGKASGVWVPLACIFMGLFGVDLYFAANAYPAPSDGSLHDISTFVDNIQGIRLFADTFMQAVACGFFVIPLRAIVQERSNAAVRSRVISSSNMMDAVFILTSSIISTVLLGAGMSIQGLYLTVSVITIFVALALFKIPSLRATKTA
jgi:acyl-[acyl-carrier-protein]-phospholipid O-acyltransferase/long-chain-fatty-acid--[acyl-carrier-protein] ligase